MTTAAIPAGFPVAANFPEFFSTLTIAHRTAGRVRFRYTMTDPANFYRTDLLSAFTRRIACLGGVTGQRVSPRACSLVIEFNTDLTTSNSCARNCSP
jgi:hypothetical protein